MQDQFGRIIDYLRISVTDRCNARCVYCMPAQGVPLLSHHSILTYEEITFIASVCAQKGITRIRLTGGDPLVRKDVYRLVAMLKAVPGIEKVYLTTNGLDLERQLPSLVSAGLDGVNISLDALDERIFARITRVPETEHGAAKVLSAIDASCAVPNLTVKINCVPSGLNDSELVKVASLARDRNISVRFIELMPIGCGRSSDTSFRSRDTVYHLLQSAFGALEPVPDRRYEYCRARDFTGTFGFISPVTHRFCSTCSRLRLTADGYIKACLQYQSNTCLKPLLADGLTPKAAQTVADAIDTEVSHKPAQNHFADYTACSEYTSRLMSQIGG